MKLSKHFGQLKELGTKVLVVFMQLPDNKNQALVVATNTLPDLVQDEIIRLVESEEGQQEKDLGVFLNRKTLAVSNGASALNWLHANKKLIPVPVSAVIMTPHPGHHIALTELLGIMSEQSATAEDSSTRLVSAETAEDKKAVAENLKIEAQMLREEADRKEATASKLLADAEKPAKKRSRKSKSAAE